MRGFKVLLTIAVIALIGSSAQAALYGWSATPSFTDPNDIGISSGQDILAGWYADAGANHAFRMDIETAPVNGNFAGIYGIYIDSIAGSGGNGSDWSYLPSALNGVDYIVDYHWDPLTSLIEWHFHEWVVDPVNYPLEGGYFAFSGVDAGVQTGTMIEWLIDKNRIGGAEDFTFRMATHDGGSSTTTYDYAPNLTDPGFQIPEPATMSVLAIGLIGLLRRRA